MLADMVFIKISCNSLRNNFNLSLPQSTFSIMPSPTHEIDSLRLFNDEPLNGVNPSYLILNEANVAISYCTADLIYTFVNKKHAAMHGLAPEQIIGKHVIDILGIEANELVSPYYKRALKGECLTYEIEAQFPIGLLYIQRTYTPIKNEDDQVIGWVTVTFDMTDRHRLEVELQKNEILLRDAKEKAEIANIAKSEFLANMSHELRTPMNVIIGLLHVMNMKEYPPNKQKEFMVMMQSNAHYLLELINNILDVCKLEGEQTLQAAPFELNKILQEILITQSLQAKQKGNELILEEHGTSAHIFLGDELRFRQVLLNLVSNALKFTEKGYVKIIVEYAAIKSDATTQNMKIIVEDTGIGISAANLETIFNKFTQADNSISRIYGGSGLGLYISKRLIEMMGGTLSVESVAGKGSRFMINLCLPIQLENKTSQTVASDMTALGQPKDKEILLVEDNDGNLLIASLLLENYGYRYEVARNGKEALQKFLQRNFDVILMDVQMPDIDGFSVTRLIREREKETKAYRTPIIGLTANALQGDKERCLAAGMDYFLAKPFDPDALLKLLTGLDGQNEQAAYGQFVIGVAS